MFFVHVIYLSNIYVCIYICIYVYIIYTYTPLPEKGGFLILIGTTSDPSFGI